MKKECKTFHKLHVLGMNEGDRVRGLGSEAWKGFECVMSMHLSTLHLGKEDVKETPCSCHKCIV